MMDNDDMQEIMRQQLSLSRQQRARIEELEGERREPVAIIGSAMRFPGGVSTPTEYWTFLTGSTATQGPIPADREGLRSVYQAGSPTAGRSYVERASFLDDLDLFDAGFFGISDREAMLCDPQQRLLLETCWEATERAGLPVRRQDRLRAGVFIGLMASDYVARVARQRDKSDLDPISAQAGVIRCRQAESATPLFR